MMTMVMGGAGLCGVEGAGFGKTRSLASTETPEANGVGPEVEHRSWTGFYYFSGFFPKCYSSCR
jgi:hypothetical protein